MQKRPVGFTVLALALGWLALAGFGHAAINVAREGRFYSPVIAFLAFDYGVTALVTMVGPFGVFGMPLSLEGPLFGVLAFILFIAVLFWVLHRCVVRTVGLSA